MNFDEHVGSSKLGTKTIPFFGLCGSDLAFSVYSQA